MPILLDDGRWVAIDKPLGVEVVSTTNNRRATALDLTRETLGFGKSKQALYAVTHLDKEASGVVLFARKVTDARSTRAPKGLSVDRVYLALVEEPTGATLAEHGTIQSLLAINRRGVAGSVTSAMPVQDEDERDGDDRSERGFRDREAPRGPWRAVTHFRVLARGNGLALLQVRAETDHRQQIRAHLSERGCPVVGDRAYGSTRSDVDRLALHALEVRVRGSAEAGAGAVVRCPGPRWLWTLVGLEPPAGMVAGEGAGLGGTGSGAFAGAGDGGGRTGPSGGAGTRTEAVRTAEGGLETAEWDRVAEWYDRHVESAESDQQREVVRPGAHRLLACTAGERVLDVACGNGAFVRELADAGVEAWGVDVSARLIEAARGHAERPERFVVGDARSLGEVPSLAGVGGFDAACSLVALMNIEPIGPVLRGVFGLLRGGGRFAAVVLHPAFRSPRISAWGWTAGAASEQRQFRRVDAYLGDAAFPIVMNPGAAASGEAAVTVTHYHRSVSAYVRAFVEAGFVVDALEEWASHRVSQGPRAEEENRARAEIPMYLAVRGRKPG